MTDMPSWIIPALIVLGLILLYLEFFLPGGILAVGASIFLLVATILVFVHHGPIWGSITALVILAFVALLLRFWMGTFHRSFLGKRITIQNEVGEDEYLSSLPSLLGKTGHTVTELHPSGKAIIDGEKYDVVSPIGVIPPGTAIIVQSIEGIRISVMPMKT